MIAKLQSYDCVNEYKYMTATLHLYLFGVQLDACSLHDIQIPQSEANDEVRYSTEVINNWDLANLNPPPYHHRIDHGPLFLYFV